jgi:hypothetical protein
MVVSLIVRDALTGTRRFPQCAVHDNFNVSANYFKGLANETGLPYQKLIDVYLVDCAKKRKKLRMKRVA